MSLCCAPSPRHTPSCISQVLGPSPVRLPVSPSCFVPSPFEHVCTCFGRLCAADAPSASKGPLPHRLKPDRIRCVRRSKMDGIQTMRGDPWGIPFERGRFLSTVRVWTRRRSGSIGREEPKETLRFGTPKGGGKKPTVEDRILPCSHRDVWQRYRSRRGQDPTWSRVEVRTTRDRRRLAKGPTRAWKTGPKRNGNATNCLTSASARRVLEGRGTGMGTTSPCESPRRPNRSVGRDDYSNKDTSVSRTKSMPS